MDSEELRTVQAPLKARYRNAPEAALVTLSAQGRVDQTHVACKVQTGRALVTAGLHPATGGSGLQACSGDMLLEALAACAGVTLKAVATSIGVRLRDAVVHAEGDIDFRGTLGVERDVAVGFQAIRVRFEIDADASQPEIDRLVELTERYCVVFQSLNVRPELSMHAQPTPGTV
ncbi:OsmC family protein [Salinactinospora qingdaonensis]|uniref:OsmC family protein n=1 Tax=Salinactinospora qingdaonensis TaxID=702744 RepID=A0ABP7F091_9ACTN